MADNIVITPGTTGVPVATDEIGEAHYQRIKITDGTPNSGDNHAKVNFRGSLQVENASGPFTTNGVALNSLNATLGFELNGESTLAFNVISASGGTQVCEVSVNGSSYTQVSFVDSTGATQSSFTSAIAGWVNVAGWKWFRVRRSLHSSGQATIHISASAAAGPTPIAPLSNTVPVQGSGAHAVAVTTNPVAVGYRSATVNPGSVLNGQLAHGMVDKLGRQVVVNNHVRELCNSNHVTLLNHTNASTLIAAGGANVFNDLTSLEITNGSDTAVTLTLSDGSKIYIIAIAAKGGYAKSWTTPRRQTNANQAWTIQSSAAVTALYVNVDYVINL